MPNSRSLSIATTRACGKLQLGVGFEFDALLEVDEIELQFARAVVDRQVRDQGVHQRRLARTGLAGDQHVLRSALAQLQVLQLGGAGPSQRHLDLIAAIVSPPFILWGRHRGKRDFDAIRVLGLFDRRHK